jgi:isoleucyl-tRNA synthetase
MNGKSFPHGLKNMDYKNTLNLPKTDFPMKADLPKREPQFLERWQKENLYGQLMEKRKGGKKWILHQGPPFVNGDAHMGHALNMTLKDIVLKYKNMTGHYAPFVPGWDCHGLPIEHKVAKELGESVTDPVVIRKKCEEFARKYIKVQGDQFQRLGVFADWENPYRTLDPACEAYELRGIAMLVEKGWVYEGLRPVLWSYGCTTALAEAEIEYARRVDPAVYAKFKLTADSQKKFPGKGDVSLLIWTTTPWTLPSNLAVAVSVRPEMTYALYNVGEERLLVLKALAGSIPNFMNAVVEKELSGKDLVGLQYQHPFLSRTGGVFEADFVTADAGTGLVHIAPGHGPDDYFFGVQHKLEILSPVDDAGKLTAECGVPELVGKLVFDANKDVIRILKDKNALWETHDYPHDYPHCWRSKTPIVFRAVKQWFIKVDAFRQDALAAIDKVNWIPDWGKNRIRGSVLTRPDWCISRQRTWGVPIPVFYDQDDNPVLTAEQVREFADIVEKEGTNVWFATPDEEMAKKLGLAQKGLRKGRATLDVWIDSGTTHYSVLRQRSELHFPADLYLEGSDQHRGWFQSSLMMSVAMTGEPPYKEVLTNGFVVDGMGKKLSKSAADGKPTDLMTLVNMYGADILRLWVASQDYTTDVPFSEDIFARVADTYRSIRNTLRILLANLYDFDPNDKVLPEKWTEIDRYIYTRLQEVIKDVRAAYDEYNFAQVYQTVNLFCTVDLSSLYIDVLKDRMYCDAANDPKRRAAQTVMREIAQVLCKLLAPILPYTAEEGWQFLGNTDSVHVQTMPDARTFETDEFKNRWKEFIDLRFRVNSFLEELRKNKQIGKSLESQVVVHKKGLNLQQEEAREIFEELFIVSKVEVDANLPGGGDVLEVKVAPGKKCARCWKVKEEVGKNADFPDLCDRCADVVAALRK